MANENSNSLNGPNMPTRFTSIEELYDYQNGLPDPFATVTPVTPVDNVRISLPVDPYLSGNASNPAMLDYDDGKAQLEELNRDEYFLFKVFLNPDGAELIKRYQNGNPFQQYPGVDIFVYYEWTDRYDLETICFVRLSEPLAKFIHSGSRYRSPEAVAKKIADNYNRKKDQPYHDEINYALIEEAINFQRDKKKIFTSENVNKLLAEICFFAAKQIRKGKFSENVWRYPKDKNYSPLIKIVELAALEKVLLKVQNKVDSFHKLLKKLSEQARKAGFAEAAKLIDSLAEAAQAFKNAIAKLVQLVELGQQAIAVINAFVCGIINEITELAAGMVEVVGIIFSLDDKANRQLVTESIENAIQRIRQRPNIIIETIEQKIEEIKEHFRGRYSENNTATELAYNAGEDVVEVVLLVFMIRDLIMLIRKIPQLGEFTKTAEKVLKKDAARAAAATNKGLDDILKKLYPKEPSKARRIKDDFEIDLFQKKVDEPIQVWYKDTKIYEADETALKKWLDDLDDKNTTKRKNFLDELAESLNVEKEVSAALQKLEAQGKIETSKIPVNTLDEALSLKKIESIVKGKQGGRAAYKTDKNGVKNLSPKPPQSARKLAPDFVNTPYLYEATGTERAIVKIKMTGNRRWDDLLAFELSSIKATPNLRKNYVWHHLDDFDPIKGTCTMQLVKKSAHKACNPHTGAANLFDTFFNFGYYDKQFKVK